MLPPLPRLARALEAFRQGLRELGYVEGTEHCLLSGDLQRERLDRLPALAAELVRLKVDVIVTTWSGGSRLPRKQLLRFRLSWRSDTDPVGTGSSPASRDRREYYWVVHPCPGDKRQTTGASEGDCSQAFPRGRPRDFDPRGQRTIVKRDRNSPPGRSE